MPNFLQYSLEYSRNISEFFLATWLTTVSIMTTYKDSRARPRSMKWPMQLVRVAVFYFGVCWEWGRFSVFCATVISVKVR